MNALKGPHNASYPGKVNEGVHCNWSQRRTWHGDKVKIFVQTEFVKINPAVEVTILAKDSTEIEKPTGTTLSVYTPGFEYEVKWKGKPYGDNREFQLKVKVAEKLESALSESLYVDLDPPKFSL